MPATVIQSVDRSLNILRLVASRDGIPLRELSRSLELNTTTAYNLANTLVRRGFLDKTESPVGYRLGPAVGDLLTLSRHGGFEEKLEEGVRELARVFPEGVVTMARYTGGELAVILRMSPQQPGVLQRPDHRTFAPYSSASGLALLAFAGADAAIEYRRLHPPAEFAPAALQDKAKLEAELDRARRRGYVALRRERQLRLAFPVREHGNDPACFAGLSLEPVPGTRADAVARQARAAFTDLIH